MPSNHEVLFYNIGKRDAMVEILAAIRLEGSTKTIQEIVKVVLTNDPTNPHALWAKDNIV